MKKITPFLLLAPFSLTQISMAGNPVDDKITCPIGGEEFKITHTMSCSTMGRTLSMRPVTSCDFITRLPQCPSNKLPIYKEFSETDLEEIKTFMQTSQYADAKEKSVYYLAYLIDQHLTSKDNETQFFLLQQGYWYTPEGSYNDDDYNSAYDATFKATYPELDIESQPFWTGAKVFNALWRKRNHEAKTALTKLSDEVDKDNEYLNLYIRALSYCINNMQDETLCTPNTALRAHEEK